MGIVLSAKEKIRKARDGLVLDHPFFGTLALNPTLVEDETCETGWMDGRSIAYNPFYIEGLKLDEVKGFFAHEVMHGASQHQLRRGERDPKKWNMAADYSINGLLIEEGFTLPPGALYDPQYKGMSAEAIYNLMPSDAGEDQGEDPGGSGGVRDDPQMGKSEAAISEAAQEWMIAVNQSKQLAKGMGKLSEGMARVAEKLSTHKVDWREVLRNFIQVSSNSDYSWSHPNRRFISQGIYLPSLKSLELGLVGIGLDTSGSVDDEALKQFNSEVASVKDEFPGSSMIAISCDSSVKKVQEFGPYDEVDLDPVGGGGTDFRPPFEYMDEQGEIPSCFVYFTDGRCHRFPPEPPYPVLWVLWVENNNFKPPFGEAVMM